jgi:hypothetical protein
MTHTSKTAITEPYAEEDVVELLPPVAVAKACPPHRFQHLPGGGHARPRHIVPVNHRVTPHELAVREQNVQPVELHELRAAITHRLHPRLVEVHVITVIDVPLLRAKRQLFPHILNMRTGGNMIK